MYQALQFLLGAHLPAGSVDNMTEESMRDIWVLGVRHLPALIALPGPARRRGYLFHSEFNEGDARTALMGTCPELVRVDNGLKWHNTHSISTEVPRVVHPDDVRTRKMHVVGRRSQKTLRVWSHSCEGPGQQYLYSLAIVSKCILHVP